MDTTENRSTASLVWELLSRAETGKTSIVYPAYLLPDDVIGRRMGDPIMDLAYRARPDQDYRALDATLTRRINHYQRTGQGA